MMRLPKKGRAGRVSWIYIDGSGRETRIADAEAFADAVAGGLIRAATPVRRETEATWTPAREFGEFNRAPDARPIFAGGLAYASLRQATLARNFIVFGCLAGLIGSAVDIFYLRTILGLLAQHGLGNVPLDELPVLSAETSEQIYIALRWVGALAILIAGFRSMFCVADAVKSISSYRHKIGKLVIVITMFVPLANVVVPWLGLADIRRSAIALVDPVRAARFSWATLGLTVSYMLFILVVQLVDRQQTLLWSEAADSTSDLVGIMNGAVILKIVDAAALGGIGAIFAVYCSTALKHVRKALG